MEARIEFFKLGRGYAASVRTLPKCTIPLEVDVDPQSTLASALKAVQRLNPERITFMNFQTGIVDTLESGVYYTGFILGYF